MGQFNLVSVDSQSKKSEVFTYSGGTREEVAQAVKELFGEHGYKLEKGDKYDAIYGIGSAAMRVLFGAFVKRYVFGVVVEQDGDNVSLTLNKKIMAGVAGGAIGYAKMNSETERWKIRLREL